MHKTRDGKAGGFTMLELITTMAVGVVLVGFAVPSMSAFLRSNRAMTVADSFNSAVSKARTIAAATNSYVTVAPTTGGDWQSGWQVFNEHASPNGEYTQGVDNLISQGDPLPSDVIMSTSTTPQGLSYISFSPTGYSQTTGKAQMSMTVGFTVGEAKRVVEISLLGRSRVCNPGIDTTTCVMP